MERYIFSGNLKGSEKLGGKKSALWLTREGWKLSSCLSPIKTPLSQNQSMRISTGGIITAINSRGSFSYANYNCFCDKMNFSLPLLLMLLVMEHWLLTHFQYGEMSPVTSGNLFSGSLSLLAQQTEICPVLSLFSHHWNNNLSSWINNQSWRGNFHSTLNKFTKDQGFFPNFKPKTGYRFKACFTIKNWSKSLSGVYSPYFISTNLVITLQTSIFTLLSSEVKYHKTLLIPLGKLIK